MSENPLRERAAAYISMLDEATMRMAWGDVSSGDRCRIVEAAIVFGERFEERVPEGSEPTREDEIQRLLMRIMGDVIRGMSEAEGMTEEEATEFLGDIGVRDKVLETNEVLTEYESGDSTASLDSLLRSAVGGRKEKAVWADHWRSG